MFLKNTTFFLFMMAFIVPSPLHFVSNIAKIIILLLVCPCSYLFIIPFGCLYPCWLFVISVCVNVSVSSRVWCLFSPLTKPKKFSTSCHNFWLLIFAKYFCTLKGLNCVSNYFIVFKYRANIFYCFWKTKVNFTLIKIILWLFVKIKNKINWPLSRKEWKNIWN